MNDGPALLPSAFTRFHLASMNSSSRFAHLKMREQVEVVAFSERQDRQGLALAAGLTVATDDTADDPRTKTRAGLWREATVIGEDIGAVIGRAVAVGATVICRRTAAAGCAGNILLVDGDQAVEMDAGAAESRKKVRSGKPSPPLTMPARRQTSITPKPLFERNSGMSDAKTRSLRAYSACNVMLPRSSAKFLPTMPEIYWLPPNRRTGDAGLGAQLDAFIVAAQHEVDDAGDRVRTVNRRLAAGDDVDAFDQVVRDGVDVGRHSVVQDVGRDVTTAVDAGPACARCQGREGRAGSDRRCRCRGPGSAGQRCCAAGEGRSACHRCWCRTLLEETARR